MDTENELIEDACMERRLSDTIAISRADVDFATAKGMFGWLPVLKGLPFREHPKDSKAKTIADANIFCMGTSLSEYLSG